MIVLNFCPNNALAQLISVSAESQSVDILSNADRVRIVNTSTGAVAIKMGLSAAGAITAAFTEGEGLILNPGTTEVITRPGLADRFAVIGLSANGYVQITPGVGV